MAFDPQALMALDIPETTARYDWRDVALYALGTGAGLDPLDTRELRWVSGADLVVLPTMATVLGYRGFWIEELPTGIDVRRVLHGEQSLRLTEPLPASGVIRRKTCVTGVTDKGMDRGSLVHVAERISDAETGDVMATMRSTLFCRSEGGHGSVGIALPGAPNVPDRAPDLRIGVMGSPQQALIYRLSGDTNPLHSDPAAAQAAGFPQPILHGLAGFGAACRVLMDAVCVGECAAFRGLDARFTAPAFPGEPLELTLWHTGLGEVAFRLFAIDRGQCILDRGRFEFAAVSP